MDSYIFKGPHKHRFVLVTTGYGKHGFYCTCGQTLWVNKAWLTSKLLKRGVHKR